MRYNKIWQWNDTEPFCSTLQCFHMELQLFLLFVFWFITLQRFIWGCWSYHISYCRGMYSMFCAKSMCFLSLLCYCGTCEASQRLTRDVLSHNQTAFTLGESSDTCLSNDNCVKTIGTRLWKMEIVLFITYCDLCFSFEPPGSLSAGMSCDMQAVFQPMVSHITTSITPALHATVNTLIG